MKKVGILTFQQTVNYGAVLQMYALQKVVSALGYDVEIINYDSIQISEGYKPFHYKNVWEPKAFLSELLNCFNRIKRNQKFTTFIQKNMKMSPLVSKDKLMEIGDYYDYYIVGSDQVWNPGITGNDSTYFFDFVSHNEKKLSYAASFGVSQWPQNSPILLNQVLRHFHHISVREKTGMEIIHKAMPTRDDITVDVDPVFLLKRKEWQRLVSPAKNAPYIFVYTVGNPQNVYQYASKLASEKKVNIINLRYAKSFRRRAEQIGQVIYDASPEEFVSLIGNAAYVVTNSFHATAFSLIFNREVFVEMPAGLSSRIQDLFSLVGLSHRTIDEKIEPINWQDVNENLEIARAQSMRNLSFMLND